GLHTGPIESDRCSAVVRRCHFHYQPNQEAPSAAPEGQGESSPGQKSAANAALGNRPLTTTPTFHGPPRQPAGWRGGPWKVGIFITSLPQTALRLSGATLMSSLRDFGLACARRRTTKMSDRQNETQSDTDLQGP